MDGHVDICHGNNLEHSRRFYPWEIFSRPPFGELPPFHLTDPENFVVIREWMEEVHEYEKGNWSA